MRSGGSGGASGIGHKRPGRRQRRCLGSGATRAERSRFLPLATASVSTGRRGGGAAADDQGDGARCASTRLATAAAASAAKRTPSNPELWADTPRRRGDGTAGRDRDKPLPRRGPRRCRGRLEDTPTAAEPHCGRGGGLLQTGGRGPHAGVAATAQPAAAAAKTKRGHGGDTRWPRPPRRRQLQRDGRGPRAAAPRAFVRALGQQRSRGAPCVQVREGRRRLGSLAPLIQSCE